MIIRRTWKDSGNLARATATTATNAAARQESFESTFATVPHRTKVAKGPGLRAAEV